MFLNEKNKHDVYKGEWHQNKQLGKGIWYYHKSGIIIEGIFNDGKLDSSGSFKIRYANGDIYEGQIENHKMAGKGKFYHINGDIYEGDWVNDKRDGKGKFYVKSDDIMIEGEFTNNEIISGKITDKEGNVFTTSKDPKDSHNDGRFLKGKLFGRVKIEYANGNYFSGMFSDGKKCGEGKMVYKNLKL